MYTSKLRAMLVLAFFLTAAFGASAQEPSAPPEPGFDQGAPAEPVDDETVEQFAEAYASVQSIQEDYTQRLQEADDREQAQNLQQEAQEEMLETVQDHGLSVQDYNEMIARMDQDPELRQKVFNMVMDE